ncbi:MAG: calcium-binding protein, partial [Pseudomonadota bacterium]
DLRITTAQNTVGAGIDTILNIEHLTGGIGADTFTGTAGNNRLIGEAGNDSLDGGGGTDMLNGGSGNDTMIGGDGNDTYFVDNSMDIVIEIDATTAGGIDSVTSSIGSFVLGPNVEEGVIASTGAADMSGNELNNKITAGKGNNVIDGGVGIDTVNYGASSVSGLTIDLSVTTAQNTGGSGTDTLTNIENVTGSQYADSLTGTAGNNQLTANPGNDTLDGAAGDDVLDGGDGNDSLTGGTGNDRFNFSRALNPGTNLDVITDFVSGTDRISLFNHVFTSLNVSGELSSVNFHVGTAAADSNDFIIYNPATGILYYDEDGSLGGHTKQAFAVLAPVNSVIPALTVGDFEINVQLQFTIGGTTSDNIVGTAGNDAIIAAEGDDTLSGGEGNDVLTGGSGSDNINGGPGIDTASYNTANNNAVLELSRGKANDGEGGADTLTSIENLTGGPLNDTMIGNELANVLKGEGGDDIVYGNLGDDTLVGGSGNDFFRGGEGHDVIDGGAGIDTVDYSTATASVFVDLYDSYAYDGDDGDDLLINIENVMGSGFNDELVGNAAANRLEGGKGNDDLEGGGGNDTLISGAGDDNLIGGAGNDELAGGRGADYFVFNLDPAMGNTDTITDFNVAQDTIVLARDIFGSLPAGDVPDIRFRSGAGITAAADSNDNVIYDTTTGNLYYDADGIGSSHFPTLVAMLTTKPALTAADILVYDPELDGSSDPDNLIGGRFDDLLEGHVGNDTLVGGGGDDDLVGGNGNDSLTGGDGEDYFFFDVAPAADNVDTITDFSLGDDALILLRDSFPSLLEGDLSSTYFRSGNGLVTANDSSAYLIYNTGTGTLYYDADANGGGLAQAIVTLIGKPALSADSIYVYDASPDV